MPPTPSLLRRHALTLATVVAAAVTALLLVKPVLGVLMERNSVHNGAWRTSASTGSADADPWTRAAVAMAGLYALSRKEAVYFTAFSDSDGEPFRGECDYLVSGATPDARWWSLTAYGADHFLVPNAADRYAVNAGNLPSAGSGRIELALSAAGDAERADLLPVPAAGAFSLTLRLYNPPEELAAQLASVALPQIRRGDCR